MSHLNNEYLLPSWVEELKTKTRSKDTFIYLFILSSSHKKRLRKSK